MYRCDLHYRGKTYRRAQPQPKQREAQLSPMSFPKFYTYPQHERDRIIQSFWADYFTQFPDPGSSDELNTMREQFQTHGSVILPALSREFRKVKERNAYEQFRSNHRTVR